MKRQLFVRTASAILASLMLLTTIACGSSNQGKDDTAATTSINSTTPSNSKVTSFSDMASSDAVTQPTGPAVDANGYELDDLPDDLNYNNATVTFLTWEDVEHEEFFVESQNGDVVNDAMYTRQQIVEERLGIRIEEIMTKGNASYTSNWLSYVQNDNMSGSHAFDMMAGYSQSIGSTTARNLCYDLLSEECSYLNFDKPWWPDALIDQVTIKDKLFFASGDISMNVLYMMYVCFVNNDLLEAYHLENPAELVQSGKWTYDKFIEMCSGVYSDLDGNGEKNQGDQFGYLTCDIHADPWFYASGALVVDKDENGALRPAPSYSGERVISTIEKLNTLLHASNDGIYIAKKAQVQTEFRDGRVLFVTDRARASFNTIAENTALSYSIGPAPKFDEEQENYYTVMGNPFTRYAAPADSTDPARAAAVLECFASESHRLTTPAVFEITLKLKYSQNEISAQMYDVIRSSVVFDIGRMFKQELIDLSYFRTCLATNNNDWVSMTKANLPVLAKKLAILEAVFE